MKPKQLSIAFPDDDQPAEVTVRFGDDLDPVLARLKEQGRVILAWDTVWRRGEYVLHTAAAPPARPPASPLRLDARATPLFPAAHQNTTRTVPADHAAGGKRFLKAL